MGGGCADRICESQKALRTGVHSTIRNRRGERKGRRGVRREGERRELSIDSWHAKYLVRIFPHNQQTGLMEEKEGKESKLSRVFLVLWSRPAVRIGKSRR